MVYTFVSITFGVLFVVFLGLLAWKGWDPLKDER